MQGSICPLPKFFLQEETKKLKSKLVTLISNISISEKKGTHRFYIVILPTDILVLNPRWKRINVESAQTSKMTFNSRHLLNVYLEDSMRFCMQGKHEWNRSWKNRKRQRDLKWRLDDLLPIASPRIEILLKMDVCE